MDNQFTQGWLKSHAEKRIKSQFSRWFMWIWQDIAIWKVFGTWDPDITPKTVQEAWDVFIEIIKTRKSVYVVVDTSEWVLPKADFRDYMKSNWSHVLDRHDFTFCVVDSHDMQRLIRRALLRLIGRTESVFLFKTIQEAFEYISLQKKLENTNSIPVNKSNNLALDRIQTQANANLMTSYLFVDHQLKQLSHGDIKYTRWSEKKNLMGATVYTIVAHLEEEYAKLSFFEEELLQDHSSVVWESILLDKIKWFIDNLSHLRKRDENPDLKLVKAPTDPPHLLTKEYIRNNAQYRITSSDHRWSIAIWESVVILEVRGYWSSTSVNVHMSDIWDVFHRLREYWHHVHTIVDLAGFDIQSEEFRMAMKSGWVHTLDRGDLTVYFLDDHSLRRTIRQAIVMIMGKQKRIKIFEGYREALDHVFLQMILEHSRE